VPQIIYTPDIFSLQRVGGISRYICELVRHLQAEDWDMRIMAGIHLNRCIRDVSKVSGVYLPRLGPGLGHNRLRLNYFFCRRAAAQSPSAVIHQTYYSAEKFPSSHPVVITAHDLTDELYPDRPTALAPGIKRQNCLEADHVIAVSENTKKDLIEIFNVPPDKISVIYLADSLEHPVDTSTPPAAADPPYLLFGGARDDYKNFKRLVQAIGQSNFLKNTFRLIAFGGGPFSKEEAEFISAAGMANKVTQVNGADPELARSYRQASAFVYPSLYEGFGLPIVEAMGQNCPVLCSDPGGSVPEIAGDAAAYFDGREIDDIRLTLEANLRSPSRLTELRNAGKNRHKFFSWTKCATETGAVYGRLHDAN
jgi:glycosyltransferase involved in cell wall biosynthesis